MQFVKEIWQHYKETRIEEKKVIIDSIPHCPIEIAFKRGKNKDMWLHFYFIQKMEYLSSIVFHTAILKML